MNKKVDLSLDNEEFFKRYGCKKTVSMYTLGCKVNQYETDAMKQLFEKSGYTIVDFNDKPNIYVINTCTVTNMADKKSRQIINRAKKNNNNAILIVVGCYAQSAKEILEKDDRIDIVIGTSKKNKIIEILNLYFKDKEKKNCIDDVLKLPYYEHLLIDKVSDKTRAYIKIQDGCNQFCSYCIIPYMRGRVRSRKQQDILFEVKQLVSKGYKEIIITGIHIASYGIDNKNNNLLDLLIDLNAIENLKRIRLGSLEPSLITEKFVVELKKLEKVCSHFHLSLQSGYNSVLKRMNRRYTTDDFEKNVNILRQHYKRVAITTDIIVGFPGETQDEFESTYNFIKKIGFADTHIFKYSKREGTKAATFSPQIKEEIKQKRSKKLINLSQQMKKEYQSLFLNQVVEVLFEEKIIIEDTKYIVGYTREYMKVAVRTKNYIVNRIKKVKVIKMINNTLVGEILD